MRKEDTFKGMGEGYSYIRSGKGEIVYIKKHGKRVCTITFTAIRYLQDLYDREGVIRNIRDGIKTFGRYPTILESTDIMNKWHKEDNNVV